MEAASIEICKKDDLKGFIPFIDITESGNELIEEIEENSKEMYALSLDDKIIGLAYIDDVEDDEEPYFSIYIFKEYRNKGYASSVLKQIEHKYEGSKAKSITAIYGYHNVVAKNFLLKHGYTLTWASTNMQYSGDRFEEVDLPIRQYQDEDFDQAFKLSAEAFHRMRVGTGCFPNSVVSTPHEKSKEHWLKEAENEFVIDQNGEIVGYSHLEEKEIASISIKISEQGKGLGKKFVKSITNTLIDRGVKEPLLWCVVGNNNARHIYDSLGYKEIYCEGFAEKKIK